MVGTKNKSDLSAAFDDIGEKPATPVKRVSQTNTNTKNVAPSRVGMVLIGAHFPPEAQQALRIIAAEDCTTNKALLAEALNWLFAKKGKDIRV